MHAMRIRGTWLVEDTPSGLFSCLSFSISIIQYRLTLFMAHLAMSISSAYQRSNACGQLHQSYQDYECADHEKHMECPVKKDMTITATTNAKW